MSPMGSRTVFVRYIPLQRFVLCTVLTQTPLIPRRTLIPLGATLFRTWTVRLGLGKGRWLTSRLETLSECFMWCILLPKSRCSGLMTCRPTPLGRLLMPRRDPTAVEGLPIDIDLTMLGQTAFRVS